VEKTLTDLENLADDFHLVSLGKAKVRSMISRLEEKIKREVQVNIEPTHHFSDGVYAREIRIPKGTLITGAIHKFKNMNMISQGDVSFMSIDGSMRVKAPYTFVASPGVKRVIFAHTDTVWTTIHGTNLTNLKEIEEFFIAKDYSEIDKDGEIELTVEEQK
jgi:hypothetical protein